jgi:serine/threonine protein phosphatase Stp1
MSDTPHAPPDRSPRWRSVARTDTGLVRGHNEDSFVDRPAAGVWAVADGMGGHSRGEVASGRIREALEGLEHGGDLEAGVAAARGALLAVHQGLRAEGADGGRAAGSTVVALLAAGDRFACCWAGDSRLYRLREGRLERLTRDHSLVEDLVASGVLAPAAARTHPLAHRITRAVGAVEGPLELDVATGALAAGDLFLLCSDGLHGVLPDAAIALPLRAFADLGRAADVLVEATRRAGAPDNVTVVLVAVGGDGG